METPNKGSMVHDNELDMQRQNAAPGHGGALRRTLAALHWYPDEYRAIGSPRRAIDRDAQEKFPKFFE